MDRGDGYADKLVLQRQEHLQQHINRTAAQQRPATVQPVEAERHEDTQQVSQQASQQIPAQVEERARFIPQPLPSVMAKPEEPTEAELAKLGKIKRKKAKTEYERLNAQYQQQTAESRRIYSENMENQRSFWRQEYVMPRRFDVRDPLLIRDPEQKENKMREVLNQIVDEMITRNPELMEDYGGTVEMGRICPKYREKCLVEVRNEQVYAAFDKELEELQPGFEELERQNARTRLLSFAVKHILKEEDEKGAGYADLIDKMSIEYDAVLTEQYSRMKKLEARVEEYVQEEKQEIQSQVDAGLVNQKAVVPVTAEQIRQYGGAFFDLKVDEDMAMELQEALKEFIYVERQEDGQYAVKLSMPDYFPQREGAPRVAFRKNYNTFMKLIAQANFTETGKVADEEKRKVFGEKFEAMTTAIYDEALMLGRVGADTLQKIKTAVTDFVTTFADKSAQGWQKDTDMSKVADELSAFFQELCVSDNIDAVTNIGTKLFGGNGLMDTLGSSIRGAEETEKEQTQEESDSNKMLLREGGFNEDEIEKIMEAKEKLRKEDAKRLQASMCAVRNADVDSKEVFFIGECDYNAVMLSNMAKMFGMQANTQQIDFRRTMEDNPEKMRIYLKNMEPWRKLEDVEGMSVTQLWKATEKYLRYMQHSSAILGTTKSGYVISAETFAADAGQLASEFATRHTAFGLYKSRESFSDYYALEGFISREEYYRYLAKFMMFSDLTEQVVRDRFLQTHGRQPIQTEDEQQQHEQIQQQAVREMIEQVEEQEMFVPKPLPQLMEKPAKPTKSELAKMGKIKQKKAREAYEQQSEQYSRQLQEFKRIQQENEESERLFWRKRIVKPMYVDVCEPLQIQELEEKEAKMREILNRLTEDFIAKKPQLLKEHKPTVDMGDITNSLRSDELSKIKDETACAVFALRLEEIESEFERLQQSNAHMRILSNKMRWLLKEEDEKGAGYEKLIEKISNEYSDALDKPYQAMKELTADVDAYIRKEAKEA